MWTATKRAIGGDKTMQDFFFSFFAMAFIAYFSPVISSHVLNKIDSIVGGARSAHVVRNRNRRATAVHHNAPCIRGKLIRVCRKTFDGADYITTRHRSDHVVWSSDVVRLHCAYLLLEPSDMGDVVVLANSTLLSIARLRRDY